MARQQALDWRLRALAAAALTGSLAMGVAFAHRPTDGLIALAVLVGVPLAFANLRIALVGATLVAFLEPIGLLGKIPFLATIVLVVVWLGTVGRRRAHVLSVAAHHRGLLLSLVALIVWLALTIAWSSSPHDAIHALPKWLVAGGLLIVVATSASRAGHARLLVGTFIVGALISLTAALAGPGVSTTQSAVATAASARISGGAGDPNYLAAGLVPAAVLAAGLAATGTGALRRLGLLAAMGALVAGFAATQSRGGLVAFGIAVLAGLVLARGRRAQAIGVVAGVLAVAALFFVASPGAFHRITDFNGGGNGRTDLWTVAWRMSKDHPLRGVGLDNFTDRAADYVGRPGALQFVDLIVDKPHVAHNMYLQQLAETGIVGLLLLLAVVGGCLRSALIAASRFEQAGDRDLALLARACAVAIISMLAASFFISDAIDKRLWYLLGLGPAMLAVAISRGDLPPAGRYARRP